MVGSFPSFPCPSRSPEPGARFQRNDPSPHRPTGSPLAHGPAGGGLAGGRPPAGMELRLVRRFPSLLLLLPAAGADRRSPEQGHGTGPRAEGGGALTTFGPALGPPCSGPVGKAGTDPGLVGGSGGQFLRSDDELLFPGRQPRLHAGGRIRVRVGPGARGPLSRDDCPPGHPESQGRRSGPRTCGGRVMPRAPRPGSWPRERALPGHT